MYTDSTCTIMHSSITKGLQYRLITSNISSNLIQPLNRVQVGRKEYYCPKIVQVDFRWYNTTVIKVGVGLASLPNRFSDDTFQL